MRLSRSLAIIGTYAVMLGSCTSTPTEQTKLEEVSPLPVTLQDALESKYRSSENKLRDNFRNPYQTLMFFGIRPGMSVLEVSPSRGWYTEILAPYLARTGNYVAAVVPGGNSEYWTKVLNDYQSWFKANPELNYSSVDFTPSSELNLGEADSYDMALIFRNLHGWVNAGQQDKILTEIYRVLKPGATLGLVAHRAKDENKTEAKDGYLGEKAVIAMAEKAGFILSAKSEVNANPKDNSQHDGGVWALPPGLRHGEKDKDKYLAIGESDRMTLRFTKPSK